MAKKDGPRVHFYLECTECGDRNYRSSRSRLNTPDKMKLMKYSPRLKKHTLHKEVKG